MLPIDDDRFDRLVASWHTRRAALGFAAGIAGLLGAALGNEAEARCKKKCGPCRRCTRGKCRPKAGSPRCGPCSVCDKGKCKARCSADQCTGSGKDEVCLKECAAPCDTCSRCDPLRGECEPVCESQFCVDEFCSIPCNPPCGDCEACDFGECVSFCGETPCVGGRCQFDCDPACAADEECFRGGCYPVCDPPCAADQGCVASGTENQCIALAGNCAPEADWCTTGVGVSCTVNGRSGRCDKTADGGSICNDQISCVACETTADCQDQGFGANSRCLKNCLFCAGTQGGSGCVRFAGG